MKNIGKLYVKRGIERLAKVYCWPNDPTITDKDKYEFKALCEFVAFKEFVKKPFFNSLVDYLFKHIAKLYQHLSKSQLDKTQTLTYKEAYLFMRLLGIDKVKQILEQIPCPSNTYNGIIRSLEEENYDLFFSTLDKSDFTKMMHVLWLMRYVLLGEKEDWNAFNPSTPHLELLPYFPSWIERPDYYTQYFETHVDDNEFIDERIVEIVNGRQRKKRRRNGIYLSTNNLDETFEEDNKKELERLFDNSLFKSQWKDILTEFTNNSDSPTRNKRVNTTYIEDFAKHILTHNVILHNDYVMKKYSLVSSEVYNRDSDEFIYEDENIKDFGRYILYYIGEMQNVYNIVKDGLPDTIQLDRFFTYALGNNIEIITEKDIDEKQNDGVPQTKELTDEALESEVSEKSRYNNDVQEDPEIKKLPKRSGCWLINGTNAEINSWKRYYMYSIHDKLSQQVGEFTLPTKTSRQTEMYISRICVALFYKAAEQAGLAKPFTKTPGIGVSVEKTFSGIKYFRRQDMKIFMEMLDIIVMMIDCRKNNNFYKRTSRFDDEVNTISRKNIDPDILENPKDLAIEFNSKHPELGEILTNNFEKIEEELVWLRQKIKKDRKT